MDEVPEPRAATPPRPAVGSTEITASPALPAEAEPDVEPEVRPEIGPVVSPVLRSPVRAETAPAEGDRAQVRARSEASTRERAESRIDAAAESPSEVRRETRTVTPPATRPVYRPVDRIQARPAEQPPRESAVHRTPMQPAPRLPEPAHPTTDFDVLAGIEAPGEVEHRLPDFNEHELPDSPSLGGVAATGAPAPEPPAAPPTAARAQMPEAPRADPVADSVVESFADPYAELAARLPETDLPEPRLPESDLSSGSGPTIPGEAFEHDAHPEPRLPSSLPARGPTLDSITGMTSTSPGDTRRSPSSGASRTAPRSTPRVEIALPAATPEGRGKRSGKGWLVALLILLILAAGAAAIVAIRLTAPDAPSAEMDAGELVDRARNRLQQWGLLPR